MKIIPSIDILNGRCVRLTQGNYDSVKIYREDPVDMAKELEDGGMRYLHLVDLDGARSSAVVHYRILEAIAAKTSLIIDFSGGIQTEDDVRNALACGASAVSCGSVAVRSPDLVAACLLTYGPEKILLSADALDRMIVTHGWVEQTDRDVVSFIQSYEQKGIQYVICTDVSRDGTLGGAATTLYQTILEKTGVNLIASGGVHSLEDLQALEAIGCHGAVIGKALYEGRITLKALSEWVM